MYESGICTTGEQIQGHLRIRCRVIWCRSIVALAKIGPVKIHTSLLVVEKKPPQNIPLSRSHMQLSSNTLFPDYFELHLCAKVCNFPLRSRNFTGSGFSSKIKMKKWGLPLAPESAAMRHAGKTNILPPFSGTVLPP
jgi:hypothetical protein